MTSITVVCDNYQWTRAPQGAGFRGRAKADDGVLRRSRGYDTGRIQTWEDHFRLACERRQRDRPDGQGGRGQLRGRKEDRDRPPVDALIPRILFAPAPRGVEGLFISSSCCTPTHAKWRARLSAPATETLIGKYRFVGGHIRRLHRRYHLPIADPDTVANISFDIGVTGRRAASWGRLFGLGTSSRRGKNGINRVSAFRLLCIKAFFISLNFR